MAILSMTAMGQIAVECKVVASGGQVRPVWNVFTYESTGGVGYTVTVKNALATTFRTGVWNRLRPVLSTDLVGVMIWVWLPSITGDTFTSTIVPGNGTRTGSRLSVSSAVYCYVSSGIRGRWYNGSKRFGPVSTSDVSGDELTPAAKTTWQTACNAVARFTTTGAGITFVQWNPVVWSRKLSTPPPDVNAQVGADVIGGTPYATLSTWRHRRERTVR